MDMQISLRLGCPYCSSENFEIDAPVAEKSFPEVICLPYTRDIGRFDPREGEMHGRWSEIGQDFFSEVLGYERIGILRWSHGIRVFYRVCRCPSCHCLFDVYANYTPGRTLDKIWPHLFLNSSSRTSSLGYFTRSDLCRSILITATILIISFIPRFMEVTSFYDFFLRNWGVILIRFLGFSVYIAVKLLLIRMIEMIGCDDRFEELLQIRDFVGLDYWRNYTICRFIGIQWNRFPNLSQVSIISGYPSVFVLLLIFLSQTTAEHHYLGEFVFLEIIWFIVAGFLVGSVVQGLSKKGFKVSGCSVESIVSIFFPVKKYGFVGSIIGLGVWFFIAALPVFFQRSLLKNIDDVFSLALWSSIAYSLGVGTWGIMETVLYILRGIRRIPMYIDPHNGYKSLSVLDSFVLRSSIGMSILFFFVILIVSISNFVPFDPQIAWIVAWVQIGLFGLHLAIALALGGRVRIFLLILVFFYILSLVMIGFLEGYIDVYSNLNVSLIGFMLIVVFFFHTRESIDHLRALREKSCKFWIFYYDNQIKIVEEKIKEYLHESRVRKDVNIYEFTAFVHSLELLLSLRRTVADAPTSPLANVYQRTAATFGLLVASVAPVLVEAILTRVAP